MNDEFRAALAASLAAHRAGDLAGAEPGYLRLLARSPDDAEVLHLLTVLRLQQGRPAEALPLAERAAHGAAAEVALPWNTLGNCLAALGRPDDAIAACGEAVERDPALLVARRNLANLLNRQGRLPEAEEHLRQALALAPDDGATHNDLGSVLHAQGRGAEAEAAFRRALKLRPDLPQASFNLGICAREAGDAAEIRRLLADATAAGPCLLRDTALPAIVTTQDSIPALRQGYEQGLDALMARPGSIADPLTEIGQLPQFYLGYQGEDDRPLQEKLAAALRLACPSLTFEAEHCRPGRWQPGRRRRVGVVSRHLYGHTIGKLQQGLLAALPRDRLELLVFFVGSRDDAMTRRIAAAADQTARLPAELGRARTMLAEARLDVLFYPDIGMEPFTYFLAFSRLAPLQLTTWGHPVTTGLPTMDAFVSAAAIEPAGAGEHYSERLVLPEWPLLHYARPATVVPLERSGLGLGADAPLLICPQSLFKLHPGFDDLIGRVLRRLPRARLLLIEGRPAWNDALRRRFAGAVPDVAERIGFVPRLSPQDFLALCAAADLMLDIPHWAGGNTTLEALAMGTPVLTLPGAFMRGRLTAGLLRRAGLDDLIAADADDYAAKAERIVAEAGGWRRRVHEDSAVLYRDAAAPRLFADLILAEVERVQK